MLKVRVSLKGGPSSTEKEDCGRPLCALHRTRAGAGVDFCREHAAAHRLLAAVMSEYQIGESVPSEDPPALRDQAPAGYYCAEHDTAFLRWERAGEVWYSHRDGASWCKMKEPAQGAPPAPDEPFDPAQESPLPLPAVVHSLTHFEQLLKDAGWSLARLEIDVLKIPLDRYIREGRKLQDAYTAWRAHIRIPQG